MQRGSGGLLNGSMEMRLSHRTPIKYKESLHLLWRSNGGELFFSSFFLQQETSSKEDVEIVMNFEAV